MLKIIDRYILRMVLTPMVATLIISLTLLLAERMLGFLDVTLGKKNSFTSVFKMLAYLTPNYLGLAVPIAIYLGVLFGFNRLSKSREIDSLHASGISLLRLLRPVMMLVFVLMLANLVAVGWLQPYGRYSYRSVIYTLTNVDAFELAQEGIFMKSGTRTFIVDQLDQSNNSFRNLFVFDDKGGNGSETLTASTGVLIPATDTVGPVLRIKASNRLRLQEKPKLDSTSVIALPLLVQSGSIDLPLDSVVGGAFRPRGADERELNLWELYRRQNNPPLNIQKTKMAVELHNRILKILLIPLFAITALPFALGSARRADTYRMGAAAIVLVSMIGISEQTAVAAGISGLSPWLIMWPPFIAISVMGLWRLWTVSTRVR